jgi:hypothetical protein
VEENLHAAFGDRFPVSANLQALVASGRAGIYDWTADGEPYVSDETAKLLVVGDRPSTVEQVRERALDAVASEISLMLAEEVVAAPMDIDLCMILGAGWPFYLGGITPYSTGRASPSGCRSPFPAAWCCQRRRRIETTTERQRSDSASLT